VPERPGGERTPLAQRNGRRRLIRATLAFATLSLVRIPVSFAGVAVSSARVWPAEEYTRVTLESAEAIQSQLLSLKNPDRLVLDLADVDLTDALHEVAAKITLTDPYIRTVRSGRFRPGMVRLVFDLKTEVKASVFNLPPVGEYGHRLVLDIYPMRPVDPLMAMLEEPKTNSDGASSVGKADAPVASTETDTKTEGKVVETDKPVDAAPSSDPQVLSEKAQSKNKSPYGRTVVIAIDAGHGGEDPGARGRRGSHEKNITLAIARGLKAKVDAEPGMRGVLIRDGDYFIPLFDRTAKARRAQADLFVSIHADAFINRDARGSSVFALSEHGATSAAASWLAKSENDADLIGGVNLAAKDKYLAKTLLDLSQTATINDSLKLAKAVLGEVGDVNRLHRGIVEQAGFAVLKSPDIPSILVETAFISNPEEEAKLNDAGYQQRMASALLSGIKRYFAKNPPLSRGTKLVKVD
jgi:N-acetylmuramoyl-L-alanine amidase